MTSFYNTKELLQLGLKSVGNNVSISRKASLYGTSRISIGNNVRIDDFCVLSAGKGGITIGNYIHIAVFSSLIGEGAIVMKDFSGLSSRVSVYSSNDDYSGRSMTNPMVPSEFTNVKHADVILEKHVLIGSGSIILPGVVLHEGSVVGALSLIQKDCEPFALYSGHPAKRIRSRSHDLLEKEKQLMNSIHGDGQG
jgi:galactoside O-acetyltransferase